MAVLIIVLLLVSFSYLRPIITDPDPENTSALEFQTKQGRNLVLGSSDILNQSSMPSGRFAVNFISYANLDDYGDLLTFDLAYAFKVSTNNFDVDTNESVSNEISFDSSLLEMNDFHMWISSSGIYEGLNQPLRIIETTRLESGDNISNDTTSLTISSQSSGRQGSQDYQEVKISQKHLLKITLDSIKWER